MHVAPLAPQRLIFPAFAGTSLPAVGIVVLAIVGRLVSGWTSPLGFDETFSAVIAAQPNVLALLDWCLAEIGGPVYYVLLWGWAQLFGTSVTALRAFSLIVSVATPLVILHWGHPDRRTRMLWAALLALWLPAFEQATNARCYALLMLGTTAQAIAFRHLIAAPDRRRACAWVGMSALVVLTHYHAAVIAGVQGLILLTVHRRDALRCWPALLLLIPMVGWMAIHLPLLARFATSGTWYPLLGWGEIVMAPEAFFGSLLIGYGAILCLAVGLARHEYGLRRIAIADAAVALSGLAALAILLSLGVVRPSFSWRYTVMLGPPVLLGVAAGLREARRAIAILPTVVLLVFVASVGGRIVQQVVTPSDGMRYILNLGWPSEWLVLQRATRVGFLWDSPTGRMSDPVRMAEVIGFGPRQAGHPVAVTIIPQPPRESPARSVARAVTSKQLDSLIWLADAGVPGTRAMPSRRLLRHYGWRCEDFGGWRISMLTCRAPTHPDTGLAHPSSAGTSVARNAAALAR